MHAKFPCCSYTRSMTDGDKYASAFAILAALILTLPAVRQINRGRGDWPRILIGWIVIVVAIAVAYHYFK